MNRTLTTMAVAGLALAISGCAQLTGTPAARAGRTPGQYADDKAIAARITDRLKQDPSVRALPIEVQSFQNEVQLSGFVEFPQQAQRAEEIARSIPDVEQVRNNIVVKQQMGLDERLRQSQAGASGMGAQAAGQRQETFSGEITSLSTSGQDNLRVRTEQGELPVRAAQWDQKKNELNLKEGDNVQIKGYLSGFGGQRHVVAQEISAHGKTVKFETTGQPYRETGSEQYQQ